jgi:ABC-type transporter Mla subunit MlaD
MKMSDAVEIFRIVLFITGSIALVYLALALIQLRKTLRSVDGLVKDVDGEVHKVQRTTTAVAAAMGVLRKGLGRGRQKVSGALRDLRDNNHPVAK